MLRIPLRELSRCGVSLSQAYNQLRSFSAATPFIINGPVHMVFLGPPGAGKGTFAAKIAPEFNIPHISTGSIVRDEIKRGTALGLHAKKLSEQGELVPDDVIIDMTRERLTKPDAQSGFILDGFPRTIAQAKALDQFSHVDVVVDVEFPEDLLVLKITSRRVCSGCGRNYNLADIRKGDIQLHPLLPRVHGVCDSCGGGLEQRADDREDVVRHRCQIYHKETEPLIEYYRKSGYIYSFQVRKGVEDTPVLAQTLRKLVSLRHRSKDVPRHSHTQTTASSEVNRTFARSESH